MIYTHQSPRTCVSASAHKPFAISALAIMLAAFSFTNAWAQSPTNSIAYPFKPAGAVAPVELLNIWSGEFENLNDHTHAKTDAYTQLKTVPRPRYKPKHPLMPNDGMLLSLRNNIEGTINTTPPTTSGTIAATDYMVSVYMQLVDKWNYYLPIFEGTGSDVSANPQNWQDYQTYKLIQASNAHPDIKTSGHTNIAHLKNGNGTTTPQKSTGTPPPNQFAPNFNTTSINYTEANPTAPTFSTLYNDNTANPPQAPARQSSYLFATNYYAHSVNSNPLFGTTRDAITQTPCSVTEPCYFSNNLWYKYKVNSIPTKYFSPLAGRNPGSAAQPYYGQTFAQDGNTAQYAINNYTSYMTRNPNGIKIDYLTENGEGIYNHSIPHHVWFSTNDNDMVTAYKNDPYISTQFVAANEPDRFLSPNFNGSGYWGSSALERQAVMKAHLAIKHSMGFVDVTRQYTQPFLTTGKIGIFGYYGVDGTRFNRNHIWEGTRLVQSLQRGQRYAAPDIYPINAIWYTDHGAYRGWNFINACRFVELKHVDTLYSASEAYYHYRYGTEPTTNQVREADHLFSPWVSAGWSPLEFLNMRPAQWLGMLKAIGVSGAEYYNVGFFAKTHDAFKGIPDFFDANAKFAPYYKYIKDSYIDPRDTTKLAWYQKSYDPADMIWQTTTPSYAQATMSRVANALIDENTGNANADAVLLCRDLNALAAPDHHAHYDLSATLHNPTLQATPIVVARKYMQRNRDTYLISATLQPTNGKDNFYYSTNTNQPFFNPSIPPNAQDVIEIDLPLTQGGATQRTTINARTQGSTYVYLPDANAPIFYQLDGWHEWQHPMHWDKNFDIEAELPDNLQGYDYINTLRPNGAASNDFSKFVSYVANDQDYEYNFEPTQPNKYVGYIRAVAAPGGSNPLHPGTPPVIVAEIITKDKNGTPINTQFFHIKIPICQKVSQFQWYSFGGGFQVSQSDILRGNTYTLKIQDRQSLPSGIAYIDKFYISSGAAPNNELTNVSIDCNP